jgi:kumamolisin
MARALVVTLALASVTVLLLAPGGLFVGRGSGRSPASAAPSAGENLPSFAASTGYSAHGTELAADLAPAAEPLDVEVTFRPQPSVAAAAPGTALASSAFADRFGPPVSAIETAVRYFDGAGLTAGPVSPDRLTLELSGPPSAFDRAFHTTLDAGTYDGRSVLLPVTPPSLPSALEASVAGVVGLTSGFTNFSFALAPTLGGSPITPANARSVYNLTALYNLSRLPQYPTSESIAVILWGAGYSPHDIADFEAMDYPSTFPLPTLVPYPIGNASPPSDNAPNSTDPQAVEELTLDIEWSMSMAPGATIDAIYAPPGPASDSYSPSTTSLVDAVEEALTLNVSVISMSFGTPESTDGAFAGALEPLFSEARERGITVLAASGDTGGDLNASCGGGSSVDYPALSPNVTAVGGTDLNVTGPFGTFVSETAWNGSGGGFSTSVRAPAWQEGASAPPAIRANGHRGLPDVSATAANDFLYFDGKPTQAAGTSFATPLWAGLVASMDAIYGARLGWINLLLYHVGESEPSGAIGIGLVDITSGGTCLGSATTGWDTETGWGTPRAVLLYEDLVGSFVNLSMSVTPTTVAPGGTVLVRAELENRSGAIAGTNLTVTLRASSSIGPCSGLFDSGDPTTNASGGIALELKVPYCYLGAHAVVNVSVITPKLYGVLDRRISVNLLGLDPALEVLEAPPWNYVTFAAIVGVAVGAGWWLGQGPPPYDPRRTGPKALTPSPGPPSAPATAGPPAERTPGPPPPPAAQVPTLPAGGSKPPPAPPPPRETP